MAYTFSKMKPRNLVRKSAEEELALAVLRALLDENEPLIIDNGSNYRQNATYRSITSITIEDDTYIGLVAQSYEENNPTTSWSTYQHKAHGGYDKITAYGWWSWNCPAGAHIKITGYNRTS